MKGVKDDNPAPPQEWIMQRILTLVPDFEEQGIDDPEIILRPLADHLRPKLLSSWMERRKALFAESANKTRHIMEHLQKKLDESSANLQLYEKALDLFEDVQSTSVVLHRHLLRTTGASIADMLLLQMDKLNKLKNGIEPEESTSAQSELLTPGERTTLAKDLHGSLSAKATALVDSMDGKRVENFMTALGAVAEDSGLLLKKLDKKLERTLLRSYRKDLMSQVSTETDPIALLPKVVSLLYLKAFNKALQAPGRAMSIAVSKLKDKLDDSAYKVLIDYHSATVTLLSLMSAATDDEEGDCSSDRIMTKRELLESMMPSLKELVLSPSPPHDQN